MALTAPTAPVPPTPPVVPGARQSSSQDGAAGQESGAPAGADAGRGFGVHITINPPGQDAVRNGSDSQAGTTAVVQGVPSGQQAQGKASDKPAPDKESSDAAAADVAQQARQAAVQQMLGEGDGSQQQAETAVRTDSPWPLSSGNMSFMTFLPFIIVFVAAFITFTLRNLGKKDGMAKPGSGEQRKASGRKDGIRKDAGRVDAGRRQQDMLSGTVQPGTAPKEDKSKGRHFEMRI